MTDEIDEPKRGFDELFLREMGMSIEKELPVQQPPFCGERLAHLISLCLILLSSLHLVEGAKKSLCSLRR
jgi:hypothetical protein